MTEEKEQILLDRIEALVAENKKLEKENKELKEKLSLTEEK